MTSQTLRGRCIHWAKARLVVSKTIFYTYGGGWRGHIVAHDCFHAAQTGKHLLGTQNISKRSRKHFCVSDTNCVSVTLLSTRANRKTFVSTVFLVFMLRHKILKSKFNRPAQLSMPLGVR